MNLTIDTAREITSFYLLTARKVSKAPERLTCKWFSLSYKEFMLCQRMACSSGLNNISLNGVEL